jgi:hypothetical protein
MKIRNGFVSNSSSSSFIVLLPENFVLDLSGYDFENSGYEATEEEVKKMFAQLLSNKNIWEEEGDAVGILENVLDDYVVATLDTSSEGGQIVLADPVKIKKILGA